MGCCETKKGNYPSYGGAGKKRILLVVRWPVGGIRTFMRYVYRRFDPKLYHFSIVGPDNPELDLLVEDLKDLDVEIIRISENPPSKDLALAVFRLLVSRRYDLVHSHGFTSCICASMPASLFRIPHILTSHDVLGASQFGGFSGFLKKRVMRVALSLVNAVHSVSHEAQRNLLEFFPAISEKCIVIRNGIESERFLHTPPRNLRTELGVSEDTFLIGFLGRFMSQKGFIYLVDAIEQLVQSLDLPRKPLVVSFSEGAFIREERAGISARNLDEFFRFLPFAANAAEVIKGLDLVVMPSLWEACGLLAMETLVAGTPLVASDCIGLREVIRDTPTYSVPPKDSRSLMIAIRYFMDHDMRQTFGEFSEKAAENFDVVATAVSLKDLVDRTAV